jgi:type IV pilus assembly protein PilW
MNRQSGITVIEILVGLALSLIILAGVLHIFINNKQTYRVQEAFARLQENGRFAMQFITKDLRMAGYMGCAGKITNPIGNIADYYPKDGEVDLAASFNGVGIEGYRYTDLPLQLTNTTSLNTTNVAEDTDIVQIKRASTTGARVRNPPTPTPPSNPELKLDRDLSEGLFEQYDILFVSDCENADVFVASDVSANSGSIYRTITLAASTNYAPPGSPPRISDYDEDAEVYKLVNTTYYIGINSAGQPALFRKFLSNANNIIEEELVEGVEDMQILYGEDTDDDGTPNRYVDLDDIPTPPVDWNKVVSVRIELGLRSIEDNLAAEPKPVPNQPTVMDRRLRRTFTTSIAIRNRAI